MFGYNTLGFGSFTSRVSGWVATGGTITEDGDYKVHTFTSSGTFSVANIGDVAGVEYLVVAGGGGGAGAYHNGTRAGGLGGSGVVIIRYQFQ